MFVNFLDFGILVSLITAPVFLFFLFVYKKHFSSAIFLLFSMVLGLVSVVFLKWFFAIPRPVGGLVDESGYSFPSGHVTIATIFFFALIHLFIFRIKNRVLKFALEVGCLVMIVLVGFSRIYLGVHWVSDVVGGVFLGLFCVSVSSFLCNKFFS